MPQASWGAKKGTGGERSRALWAGRALWTLVLLSLLGVLGWLLWRPFSHPRTHLVLLSGDVVAFDPAPSAPPADFIAEDFRAMLRLNEVLHRSLLDEPGPLILGSLQSPNEMQRLADRLNEPVTGNRDVLILYAAAHGLTQDGDDWLLASGADPQAPLGGRYRLASLLAQLRECEAATKLLILDAGRIEYDPLRGLLDNDFPARLVEQVEQLGDPTIFVLCSHAAGQRSHVSPALRQSVFNYFVTRGLAGSADANENNAVDMRELADFVIASVSGWVRQTTGDAAEQTPLVAWGGGLPLPHSLPVLIAVPREAKEPDKESPVDQSRAIELAQEQASVDPRLVSDSQRELNSLIAQGVASSTPQGRLGRFLGDATRQATSKAIAAAPKLPAKAAKDAPGEKSDPSGEGSKESKAEKDAPNESQPKSQIAKEAVPDKAVADKKPETKNGPGAKVQNRNGPVGPSRDELLSSLDQAWRMRDELSNPERPSARPMDYAPALWRQLEQRLLTADRRVRTGFLFDTRGISRELDELRATLSALAALPTGEPAAPFAKQFAALLPGRPLAGSDPSSLALAELLARVGSRELGEELPPLIARLDRLIASGNRTDLEAFAAELKPEQDRWIELRAARRLAERPELDWRLVQLVLEATRLSEQAACGDVQSAAWVQPEVDAADGIRLAAERPLLSGATFNREAVVGNLTQAVAAYKRAIVDLTAIRAAERLLNETAYRLPDYLAWNAAGSDVVSACPPQSDLLQLLNGLTELDELIARPAPEKIDAVRQSATHLRAARQQVEQNAAPQVVEQLLSPPISPGKAWRIGLLLETALPTAEMRAALADAWPEVDAALAAQVAKPPAQVNGEASPSSIRADDDRFAGRAGLQFELWKTAFGNLPETDFGALDKAWASLNSPGQGARASFDEHRELFSARLHDLLRDLPADIARGTQPDLDLSSPTSRGARQARLRHWTRLLRLVDPRTSSETAAAGSVALASAAAYDLVTWLQRRAMRAAEDAPPSEAALLNALAASYRGAAAAIPRQPPLDSQAPSPIELSGNDRISLTYRAERPIDLVLRNTGSNPMKAWLTTEADEKMLEVASPVRRAVYSWSELTAGESSQEPLAARAARLPPTIELAPAQSAQVPLRVTRRKASLHPAHVVIRVVTEKHIARHDIAVELPPPEDVQLSIAGPVSRWTPMPAGVELLPFANRANSFALQLANGKPVARKVDVEVFPVSSLPPQGLPTEPLSAADADRLRREISVGELVAEARGIALPGDGEAAPVLLKKPEAAAPPMAGAAGQPLGGKAGGEDAGGKAAPPASDKPPPVPLVQGLLAVITDLADQRRTFRHLTIAPQRPQRYIRPQVRYRAARERIEITVAAQDPSLLPPDGARIQAEIVEPIPPDAERQLEAVLKPPATEAELFVEVPSAPGKFVTLRLSVDDYPRAIYFRVPCSGETSDVPEDLDVLAVRIAELPRGTIYKPPTDAIPLRLAIDAPAAALSEPPLKVEVGIDRNRDRELRGDETVLVTNDRQVTAALLGISKTGELQIETKVTDITVNLPAGSLVSGRANVLAHAMLGEKEAWSEPVEIVGDGQPPRVSAVEVRPSGIAIIGSDLLVSALADDLGLSGVAKLEVAFDVDRSGKFGPATKPVAGALTDDGRWSAKLPTAGLASGASNILIQATDRAGNVSSPARASIRLLTAEEAAADAQKNNAADITGVVSYGGQPQAGIIVQLVAEGAPPPPAKAKGKAKDPGPPPIAQATTDAQGRFTLARIAPGKYAVSAEGVVRNKNRRAEEPVAFTKPAEVQPLALELK